MQGAKPKVFLRVMKPGQTITVPSPILDNLGSRNKAAKGTAEVAIGGVGRIDASTKVEVVDDVSVRVGSG